jgi:2-C-methyl-D-erythritol 4-phosphate cytidylyltransferase
VSNLSSQGATESPFLLIPAGGKGLRMGGGIPKQFRDWGGEPLLKATLRAFFRPGMPVLRGISLAVPPDWLDEVRTWTFGVPFWAVEGGVTRQESVAAALAVLPVQPDAPVMIHDGVRPFPPTEPIRLALQALSEDCEGSLLGEVSTDTLKRVDASGQVLGTEPRDCIFRAQTPQIAFRSVWQQAFDWARENAFAATDDVSLLEAMGLRVRLVPSPSSNLKITTPEDWMRAPERVI